MSHYFNNGYILTQTIAIMEEYHQDGCGNIIY